MDKLLLDFDLNPTTWVYLSSLITIAVYFKFSRFWSVRNLDLVALVAMGPGLLLATSGADIAYIGYVWLFAGCGFFLVRMLIDPMMVRRPLVEPNLSVGGQLFMIVALLLLLITTVVTSDLTEADVEGAQRLDDLIDRQAVAVEDTGLEEHGPGFPLLHLLASVPSKALIQVGDEAPEAQAQLMIHAATARTTAILSHMAVVAGMLLIGHYHFGRISTGIAAAGLYLLLPYTAQNVGRVDHALPAALLVWSVMAYRRPTISGMLLGLATGAVYYPVFLFPLWASFYWHKGLVRMAGGFALMLALLTASLALTSSNLENVHRTGATNVWPRPLVWWHGERLLGIQRAGLSHSRADGVHGHVDWSSALAGTEEPGHAAQLFGSRDVGHAVLARRGGRDLLCLVSAATATDRFPAEPRRPRCAERVGRSLVLATSPTERPDRTGGVDGQSPRMTMSPNVRQTRSSEE